MNNNFNIDALANYVRIKFDLSLPYDKLNENYSEWSEFLIEKNSWLDGFQHSKLSIADPKSEVYVISLLQVIKLLCELAKLPLFDFPKIKSLAKNPQTRNSLSIELEFRLIDYIPGSVYQSIIKVSKDICNWMALNRYSIENKNSISKLIEDKIIKKFNRTVPGGKSTIPVLRVAHSMNIPFWHLGMGVYQIGCGSKARKLDRSVCELDSAIGAKLSQNKITTANILRRAGLPVPVHELASSEDRATEIATKLGFPVVVKPSDLDRGEGVSVDIFSEKSVRHAYERAYTLSKSKQVIVERQVQGVCHRLFIFENKLLYAVKRHPISLIGDEIRTIQQLVNDHIIYQKKLPPWRQSGINSLDALALETLSKYGYKIESIPKNGEIIPLRPIESTEYGGVDEDLTEHVHPINVEIASQASKLLNLNIAGVDIISEDISKPWYENGAVINEVNFAPLLGGAEISRSYLINFFNQFLVDNGSIPIKVFKNLSEALSFAKKLRNSDKNCYLIDSEKAMDYLGQEIIMPLGDFRSRLKALLFRANVDAIGIISK